MNPNIKSIFWKYPFKEVVIYLVCLISFFIKIENENLSKGSVYVRWMNVP